MVTWSFDSSGPFEAGMAHARLQLQVMGAESSLRNPHIVLL